MDNTLPTLPEDLTRHIASFLPAEDQFHLVWCGWNEVEGMAHKSRVKKIERLPKFQDIETMGCMHPRCNKHRLFLFDLTDEDGPVYLIALSWYCTLHNQYNIVC